MTDKEERFAYLFLGFGTCYYCHKEGCSRKTMPNGDWNWKCQKCGKTGTIKKETIEIVKNKQGWI
jgi:hypothetical protein